MKRTVITILLSALLLTGAFLVTADNKIDTATDLEPTVFSVPVDLATDLEPTVFSTPIYLASDLEPTVF